MLLLFTVGHWILLWKIYVQSTWLLLMLIITIPLQEGKPHPASQLLSLQGLVKLNISAFAVTTIIRYNHGRQPTATSGTRDNISDGVHIFAARFYPEARINEDLRASLSLLFCAHSRAYHYWSTNSWYTRDSRHGIDRAGNTQYGSKKTEAMGERGKG